MLAVAPIMALRKNCWAGREAPRRQQSWALAVARPWPGRKWQRTRQETYPLSPNRARTQVFFHKAACEGPEHNEFIGLGHNRLHSRAHIRQLQATPSVS